jgi:hypothetical protein
MTPVGGSGDGVCAWSPSASETITATARIRRPKYSASVLDLTPRAVCRPDPEGGG